MTGNHAINAPLPQDLAAVIDSAKALEDKFGSYKDPIGLVVGYGLVDDHFEPLDDHSRDTLLQVWDEKMQPIFDEHFVSRKEQAVLRSAASQYLHAFHLTAAMREYRSEINDSFDKFPPGFEEIDDWQADMVRELHQFMTGTITKNTLELLREFHDTDRMALKSLGTAIGQTLVAYHTIHPTSTLLQIYPLKYMSEPTSMVRAIENFPDRKADEISTGIRLNP